MDVLHYVKYATFGGISPIRQYFCGAREYIYIYIYWNLRSGEYLLPLIRDRNPSVNNRTNKKATHNEAHTILLLSGCVRASFKLLPRDAPKKNALRDVTSIQMLIVLVPTNSVYSEPRVCFWSMLQNHGALADTTLIEPWQVQLVPCNPRLRSHSRL